METKKVMVGEKEYMFVNEWKNTRSGFQHKSTLLCDGREISNSRINYLNRTWESYMYQSSMKASVTNLMKKLRDDYIDMYKYKNDIKRMKTTLKEELLNQFNKDDKKMQDLYLLLESL